jgi:hypothetical protein
MTAALILTATYLAIGWVLCIVMSIRWPRARWVVAGWLPMLLWGWALELLSPFRKSDARIDQ